MLSIMKYNLFDMNYSFVFMTEFLYVALVTALFRARYLLDGNLESYLTRI